MRILFSFAFLVIFLVTCTEDEITTRDYPRVRTKSVKVKSGEGAFFTGEIVFKNDPIEDHGFVWGTNSTPSISNSQKISLGTKNSTGLFEGSVLAALETGKEYYVRAYAITSKYTVYGELIKFVSLGSKAPELTSIKPILGTWKDSVILVGKNFSPTTKVFFENIEAHVFYARTDSLKAIVPTSLTKKLSTVSVSFDNNVSELLNSYQLKDPVIAEITPSSGGVLIDVEIKGEFFNPEVNLVTFGSTQATAQTISTKLIKVKVPAGIAGGVNIVKVRSGDEQLAAITSYTNNPPRITGVSPSEAWVTEEITISGNHFGPDVLSNQVTIDGVSCLIYSASETSIKVLVPEFVKNKNPLIEINYNGQKVSSNQFFSVKPFVIDSIEPEFLSPFTVTSIYGKYFPATTKFKFNGIDWPVYWSNSSVINFQQSIFLENHINEIELQWNDYFETKYVFSKWIQKSTAPPDVVGYLGSQGNKAYFISAGDWTFYNIWGFDIIDSSWEKLREISSELDPTNIMINVEEELFYFYNRFNVGPEFVSLNLSTGIEVIKNLPPFNYGISYKVNNEVYVIENPGNKTKIWKYNHQTDSWSNIYNNDNYAYYLGGGSVIGDEIYFTYFDVLSSYNTQTNIFVDQSNVPFGNIENNDISFTFSIGKVIYYGLTNGEFWKYDTETKTWEYESHYMGGPKPSLFGFNINSMGYVIPMFNNSGTLECLEYDPSSM